MMVTRLALKCGPLAGALLAACAPSSSVSGDAVSHAGDPAFRRTELALSLVNVRSEHSGLGLGGGSGAGPRWTGREPASALHEAPVLP
jgi:hypothetical protein